jgi:lipopolysaccharide/colanic/teichoic acid biosynthesis glycosyltransferase
VKAHGLPIVPVAARPTPVLKRAVDILVAAVGLVVLTPLLLLVALLIRLDSPGPVIFRQRRVGRGGTQFDMYKFRTMQADAEAVLEALQEHNQGGDQLIRIPNDPRVTRVGRLLRGIGLDELPQLVNVLKGEMSLIGPRPQTANEVALYTDHQRRRLEVLPGISGLWQVTSRHDPSFDEWVRLDLEYIDRWSLLLDGRIALKTLGMMLRPRQTEQPPDGSAPSQPDAASAD